MQLKRFLCVFGRAAHHSEGLGDELGLNLLEIAHKDQIQLILRLWRWAELSVARRGSCYFNSCPHTQIHILPWSLPLAAAGFRWRPAVVAAEARFAETVRSSGIPCEQGMLIAAFAGDGSGLAAASIGGDISTGNGLQKPESPASGSCVIACAAPGPERSCWMLLGSLAKKVFGSANDRRLKGYRPKVAAINALEPEMRQAHATRSSPRARSPSASARRRARRSTIFSFRPSRRCAKRRAASLGQRHFDVQLHRRHGSA